MVAPTAVMVAPTAGRFAPTAVMVAPTAGKYAPTAVIVAPTPLNKQPLQLQSAKVQGDSSEIEILKQRIWRQGIEKDGLEAMVREQRGEYALQKDELERLRRENIQLKARIQHLEQQD